MNSHLSEQQISEWISGERSTEAATHVRDCPECAAELERTQSALLLFRDSGYQCAEYWRKQPQTRTSRALVGWAVAAAALAATLLIALIPRHAPSPQIPPRQEVFTRIPYVVPPAPYERTEVVRMDVPVAALIAAGLKMDEPAADSVSADVLVGQDGRPLAIGFPENNQ